MINLGLSTADMTLLNETLVSSHQIRITVQILDLDQKVKSDVSAYLTGGAVNLVDDDKTTRTCSVELFDPTRALGFDSKSPADGQMYLDNMIGITYGVLLPTNKWVNIPIFTGPITALSRDDDTISITGTGKELLSQGVAWRSKTWKKGADRVSMIQEVLQTFAGENKFDFGSHSGIPRLPKNSTIASTDKPWSKAIGVAAGINRQLFYDGRGTARLRPWPSVNCYKFVTSKDVITYPQLSYSSDDIFNTVIVKGGTISGDKAGRSASATVVAPSTHPLSPTRLGRNGVPRYLVNTIEDDTIRTNAEALALAQTTLNQSLETEVDVQFDCMPIPYLEPGDIVSVQTPEFINSFRIKVATIPLVAGDNMSIGYNLRPVKKVVFKNSKR